MNGKFLIIFVTIKMEKKVDYHRMNYKQVYSQIFFITLSSISIFSVIKMKIFLIILYNYNNI